MFEPQTRPSWHSSCVSQSPSSSAQGIPDAQKSSPPRVGWKQQSTSESKPSAAGQLVDPQKRPAWHSSWESQSPSSSPQGIPDAQKCSSPRVGW